DRSARRRLPRAGGDPARAERGVLGGDAAHKRRAARAVISDFPTVSPTGAWDMEGRVSPGTSPRRMTATRNLLVLVSFLLVAACGSDDHRSPAPTPTPSPADTGSVTVVHSRHARRPLPDDVTRFRFSGWDLSGVLDYGPHEVARADAVELRDVP